MKKIMTLFMLSTLIILLVACGKNVTVKVEQTPTANKDSEFVVQLNDGNSALKGFKGQAIFQMKDMDHGTIEADLTEAEDGKYTSTVNLPMEGKWTVKIKGDGVDKTIEMEVE